MVLALGMTVSLLASQTQAVTGWLHWRGPQQDGTSAETNLPNSWRPDGDNHRWSIDLSGRGSVVIGRYDGQDRVFAWGYRGEGADLVEVLACLDADSGRVIWEKLFSDFISDIIYKRYSIGSATIDPQTGNVYLMTTPGLLMAFDHRDGTILWQRSMMEELGRLTFPNGRTGAPSIEGNLVIVNAISTNWGREGPARNRFYAFDKNSSELVWSSTPGVGPPYLRDSSFCSPVFASVGGYRVFYAGTGCGNVVCVNARTGEPMWRYQLAMGGVNSSVVLHGDKVIAIHGKENIDDTGRGRMVAIRADAKPQAAGKGPAVLDPSHEVWRNNELSMFTSSPVIVGDRVYQVTIKGDLMCVDAGSGKTLWHKKLGADQLHASPLYADGKLYVPMWHDGLYIIKPGDDGAEILDHVEVEGGCIGSPSVWNGKIYLHTTKKLYCFGSAQGNPPEPPISPPIDPATTVASKRVARIAVVPKEVALRPGESATFRLHAEYDSGKFIEAIDGGTWEKYVPANAKVKSYLDADFADGNELIAAPTARLSAGAFKFTITRELETGDSRVTASRFGYMRGRVLPSPPYAQDFEAFELKGKSKTDGKPFAFPPLPWLGARLKWEITDLDGNKVLAKTLDRVLFQRSMAFIGHHDDRNYTVSADVMSDGNRRIMSDIGVVNQRYIIVLRGNGQQLEVNSNIERLAQHVPVTWQPRTWYRIKSRVDAIPDGSGVVRAKVWPRASDEPADWTIEVPVQRIHTNGSPGFYGFSPMSQFRVYIDNVAVAANE